MKNKMLQKKTQNSQKQTRQTKTKAASGGQSIRVETECHVVDSSGEQEIISATSGWAGLILQLFLKHRTQAVMQKFQHCEMSDCR